MLFSSVVIAGAIQRLGRVVFIHFPWRHWLVIGALSLVLTIIILIRKKHSVYGAICLGLTVFFGLFLLDTVVLIRWCDGIKHMTGFSLPAEYLRLIHGGAARWTEMLANVAVFIPFGFTLSEFLSTKKRFSSRRQIGRVALAAFELSLCIESLQLIFRLGVFEITDLVLNTFGSAFGASLAVVVRRLWERGEERREVTHFRP